MGNFDGFARYYDLDCGDFQEDVALYQGLADRTGSPILEVGCGTGRLLIPLAERGFTVTGIDVSGAMLAEARKKIEARGLGRRVDLIHADARDLQLPNRFALAVSAVNSFMLFVDIDDQLRVLRSVARHICTGGLLVLDLFNPDLGALSEDADRLKYDYTATLSTNISVTKCSSIRVAVAEQRIDVTNIYDEQAGDGALRRSVLRYSNHFFWRRELELLLDKAGLHLEHLYGSYDLDAFREDSPRMIAVATVK